MGNAIDFPISLQVKNSNYPTKIVTNTKPNLSFCYFFKLNLMCSCMGLVKNLPEMWETWGRSLGQEDPLEEGMATHSSVLAWRIPWIEEPGGLRSMRPQRVGHD